MLVMKLAYFSPLNPQPSGISDYSEELLPYLANTESISLLWRPSPAPRGFRPSNFFGFWIQPTTLDSFFF